MEYMASSGRAYHSTTCSITALATFDMSAGKISALYIALKVVSFSRALGRAESRLQIAGLRSERPYLYNHYGCYSLQMTRALSNPNDRLTQH